MLLIHTFSHPFHPLLGSVALLEASLYLLREIHIDSHRYIGFILRSTKTERLVADQWSRWRCWNTMTSVGSPAPTVAMIFFLFTTFFDFIVEIFQVHACSIQFLPVRRYASTALCDSNVSVRLSVSHRYCVKTKKASVMISSPFGMLSCRAGLSATAGHSCSSFNCRNV